jgi:hypothetical protein
LTVGILVFGLKANIVRLGLNYQFSYHRSDFQIRKIENVAAASLFKRGSQAQCRLLATWRHSLY